MAKLPEVIFTPEQIKDLAMGELRGFVRQSFRCYEEDGVTERSILEEAINRIRSWGDISLDEMRRAIEESEGLSRQQMLDILAEMDDSQH